MEDTLLKLQSFLRNKPMLLIGTGLSISMGLPGMGELTGYLEIEIPKACEENQELLKEWEDFNKLIKKYGLEDGLSKKPVSPKLLDFIVEHTALLVDSRDITFRNNFFSQSNADFPLSRLISFLLESLSPNNEHLEVITANYDHLIEYACDHIGITCCTGFNGNYIQQFSGEVMKHALYRAAKPFNPIKAGVGFKPVKQVKLYKPHGSLKWQKVNDDVIQCAELLKDAQRVIITPGLTKYLASMTDNVMNIHRELANESIRDASAILIIGYGFNDSHLQTVLVERLKANLPCVILTRSLSDNAKAILQSCPQILALEEGESKSTNLYHKGNIIKLPVDLWSIEGFTKNVI